MVIAQRVAVFMLIIVLGLIAARRNIITQDTRGKLSALLLTICSPLQILSSFGVDYTPELMRNVIYIAIISMAVFGVSGLVNAFLWKRGRTDHRRRMLWYSNTFFNCAFMGIPVLGSVLGDEGVIYASVFVMAFTLYNWTLGVFIMEGHARPNWRMFTQPALIAAVLGLVLFILGWKLPGILQETAQTVGSMTTPLSMLITGALLSEVKFRDILDRDLMILSISRLILQPAIIFGILLLLGIRGQVLQASVIMVGMPIAANAAMFATLYDIDVQFAGKSVAFTTVASLVTLTGWLFITSLF